MLHYSESADLRKLKLARELSLFLNNLSDKKVNYCILHPFPERGYLSETDLDVYIEKSKLKEVCLLLKDSGWKVGASYHFWDTRRFFTKIIHGFKLKLDLTTEYAIYDKESYYVYNLEVHKQTGKDGFYYLGSYHGGVFIAKKAFIKKSISSQKLSDLRLLSKRDQRLFTQIFQGLDDSNFFSFEQVDIFGNDFTSINTKIDLWKLMVAYSDRVCTARGILTISFVGQDGAGKGTYLDLLRKELDYRNLYFRDIYLGHSAFRLKLLSLIQEMAVRNEAKTIKKMLLLVYLILLPFEFLIRRGNGRYEILLTDRHPLFEPVDFPKYFPFYNDFINIICPKPDLVIHLSGDPNTLWQRKKESTFDEYLQQKERIDSLAEKYSRHQSYNIIRIDTTGTVNDTFREIIGIIDEYIQKYFAD